MRSGLQGHRAEGSQCHLIFDWPTASEEPGNLIEDLAQSQVPFLVVSGDDDRVVPTKDNIRLAEEIGAQLELFEACGHVPQEECPNQRWQSLVLPSYVWQR